jgi:hypothetical protein
VQGNTVGHNGWPIDPAGLTFHGAIHATLPDAYLRDALECTSASTLTIGVGTFR